MIYYIENIAEFELMRTAHHFLDGAALQSGGGCAKRKRLTRRADGVDRADKKAISLRGERRGSMEKE